MRNKLSKLVVVFAFFATVAIGNLSPLTASAAPDTCTWTGATNGNWATGSNWNNCDNGNVPENGDFLFFPETAQNKTMNNNLSGLQVAGLNINGTGYTIGGNALTLTGITTLTANESATISANLTFNSGSHINILPAAGKWLTITGTSTFALTSFYEVNIGSPSYSGSVAFEGNVSGDAAAQLIAVNGATASFSGSNNTFQADQVGAETDGNFRCQSTTCFGDSSNDIYMGGGIVDILVSGTFNNDFVTSTSTANVSALTADNNVSITGNGTVSDELEISQSTNGFDLQFTGSITLNESIEISGDTPGANIRLDSNLSGAGDITVNSGNALFSAANTFTGTVTVKSGAVATVDQTAGLGTTAGSTIVESGGSLMLDSTAPYSLAEPIQIAGDGDGLTPAIYKGAIYSVANDSVTLTGNITLTDDAKIYNETGGDDLIISGVISGPHDLTYYAADGAPIQVGGGAPNTYTGETYVTGGILYLEKTLAIPGNLTIDADSPSTNEVTVYTYTPNAIADSGTVTLNNAQDQLRIGDQGTTEIIGGLIGPAGLVSFQYGDSDLAIDQDFNSTFGGKFYADGESPTITKRGTGNLLLTGSMNWVLDNDVKFVVEEGTLTVNGDLQTADGTLMEVKDTGKLKGSGKVGKLSTNGGTIAPGTSPGKLTVGSLTLDATNTVEFELDGPVAGTSYDQIESSGAVNLANATLSIKPSYTPSAGQVFTIITGSSVTGTFKDLADNSTIIVDGITFRINYSSTSVTLTYVSGTYNPNASDSLVNTGTGMLLAALASIMLIAAATVLTTRRQRQSAV